MLSALSAIIFVALLSLRILGVGTTPKENRQNSKQQVITATFTPTPSTSQTGNFPPEFVYPNSRKVESATYTTTDSPEKSVDWYKNKLNEYRLGTKSIISTSSNGNYLTLIEARGENVKILIKISRKPNDSTTEIQFLP